MLLQKKQITPVINYRVSRLERVFAFWQIPNHIYAVSWLQTGLCWWDLPVFQCIHSIPLAQLVDDVAACLTLSCTSKEEKLLLEGGSCALNESFIYCKT